MHLNSVDSERFWSKVSHEGPWPKKLSLGRCWRWTASLDAYGYGQFRLGGTMVKAHRVAYESLVGRIGDLTIDHLCRNRDCVNPSHMEPVTRGENVLRGESPSAQHARQTCCKNGHPLSGENLVMDGGSRLCRTCTRARQKARRERLARSGLAFTRP